LAMVAAIRRDRGSFLFALAFGGHSV
jgi:hypothetical protein